MTVVELTAHPGNAGHAPDRVLVTVEWTAPGRQLALRYRLLGDVGRLRLPAAAPAGRVEGLWHHSCCEAFVRQPGAKGYCEFNFSPSGQWAAYHFSARRQGMRPLELIDPPAIRLARCPDEIVVEVQLDLDTVASLPPGSAIDLGLAVIVEDPEGQHSFWALRHAPGRPDFHDPSSFTLHLDADGVRPPQEHHP
jgi:hypothetical protein